MLLQGPGLFNLEERLWEKVRQRKKTKPNGTVRSVFDALCFVHAQASMSTKGFNLTSFIFACYFCEDGKHNRRCFCCFRTYSASAASSVARICSLVTSCSSWCWNVLKRLKSYSFSKKSPSKWSTWCFFVERHRYKHRSYKKIQPWKNYPLIVFCFLAPFEGQADPRWSAPG